jgi:hypothetical protein
MDDDSKSSLKVDSNRRNGLKSTGPKTAKGKRVSRWNPLKHGLLAKEVVIQTGERKENPAEFKTLLAQLGKSLEPRGVLEEMLVEGIAICYWRWRRALRCEAGEIATAQSYPSNGEGGLGLAALEALEECKAIDSDGVQERINILERLSQNLGENETLSEECKNQLKEKFGAKNGLVRNISLYNDGLVKAKKEAADTGRRDRFEGLRDDLLGYIGHEKEVLERVKSQLKKKEEFETEAKVASLNLPSGKVSEKIIRYETTLERRMHRAIENLGRLQSGRKRPPAPAA